MTAGTLSLRDVRRMLEGVVPPAMCTASADGMPHVNYLSQAEYVDDAHIALSFQFFNRSRANVLTTGRVALAVDDPYTGAGVVMQLRYLRTDTEGPLFERMRAKLAGIASHTGMENVFHLRGADVYRVVELRRVPGRRELAALPPRCDLASGARVLSDRLGACTDVAALLDTAMEGMGTCLKIDHAMLWMVDAPRNCMTLLASHGYGVSGIGAEVPSGEGLAGIAAREGVPIRVGHMTKMYAYARAVRGQAQALGLHGLLHDEIPLPGLAAPRSQLAVPLRVRDHVIGAMLAESGHDQFFSYDDEDALALICGQLASSLSLLQSAEANAALAVVAPSKAELPRGEAVRVRRYGYDNSVFLNDEYLIKGVAGAVLWKLASEFVARGRQDFTNRELRLAPELGLPDVQDNLEVRLVLLQRRLAERGSPLQIEKTGRGSFRLRVDRPLELEPAA